MSANALANSSKFPSQSVKLRSSIRCAHLCQVAKLSCERSSSEYRYRAGAAHAHLYRMNRAAQFAAFEIWPE